MRRMGLVLVAMLYALPCPAPACSLCKTVAGGNASTLREDMIEAKLVLYGALRNPRLNNPDDGSAGTTDLLIEKVIKSDPFLGDRKVVEIPRYVPVDPRNPTKFLIFCDVFKGRLDPYRGVPVKSEALVAYLQGASAIDRKDRTRLLLYFADYLEHKDEDIANDAFIEFAKASDKEVAEVGGKLSAVKIRGWLENERTPEHRLGLYAMLLGTCGGAKDADLLRALALKPTKRTEAALDGILGGYIQLRPKEGWELVPALLRDENRNFAQRYAVLRMLRFYHGWKPQETRNEVLQGVKVALALGDLGDIAVEDLRRWQMWDLTREVLAQYDKPTHAAPIVRRSIVRYALSCPDAEAKRFLDRVRQQDGEMVKEVEEYLNLEKTK